MDLLDRKQPTAHPGDDAEAAARPPHPPEQVGFAFGTDVSESPVRCHEIDGEHVVGGVTVLT